MVIDIAQATDLIWDVLSDGERKSLADNIFYPGVNVLRKRRMSVSNIQCWHGTATGLIGFLLGDKKLIATAMEDTTGGYFAQLHKGVTKEGFWAERSPNYHFYSLEALVLLATAAHNYGYPVDLGALRQMFDCPILMADGGMSIPPFNDSKMVHLASKSHLYEWAFTEFNDPRFAHILERSQRGNVGNIGPRFTGWGLLYGRPVLPKASAWPLASNNFKEAGITMLSKGRGKENLTFYMKWNPGGIYNVSMDWHTHNDQMDIAITKGGEHLVVLPAFVSYGSKLFNEWYRTGIAHNTLSMNGIGQQWSNGKSVSFGNEKGMDYTIAETDNAYDSVHWTRTACMLSENLVVIVDQIHSIKGAQLFSMTFHEEGIWQSSPQGGISKDYSHMKDGHIAYKQDTAYLSVKSPSGKQVMLSTIGNMPMDVITGYGEPNENKQFPMSALRIKTDNEALVTCIATDGQKIKMSLETLIGENEKKIPQSQAVKVNLEDANGKKTSLVINPGKLDVAGKPDLKGKTFSIEN